jgi:hypothetical protein
VASLRCRRHRRRRGRRRRPRQEAHYVSNRSEIGDGGVYVTQSRGARVGASTAVLLHDTMI